MAIILTIAFWVTYMITTVLQHFFDPQLWTFQFALQSLGYVLVVTGLTFSALMYLLARNGALLRFRSHVRTPRAELERTFAERHPSLTVLVPSYAEEPEVVRKTLLSAALQEYPDLRVVLLLDNNPNPTSADEKQKLEQTRRLAYDITELLREPSRRFTRALDAFKARVSWGEGKQSARFVGADEARRVAEEYGWAADWLARLAEAQGRDDHVDIFFIDQILLKLAEELRTTARALELAANEEATLPLFRATELYRRLIWTFTAQVSVFERKTWATLSHEPNKAMNLNSYIGLMGRSFRVQELGSGERALAPVPAPGPDTLDFPDSEFLLTLDADSMLLREYCLRLVYFLLQPENARVAVTQTPYSSYRGARTRIERLAAATTDVQHILHQGMTQYSATFWVGANAVIRKAALDDIVEIERVGGNEIRRYIQDRTVIEDTESSVDITAHGWNLVNYPERLSYSATPPDWGSLIVQRRRWANGGLLIIPNLFRLTATRRRAGDRVTMSELMLRLNYTGSIAWASLGLVFLLAFPYDSRLLSPFIVASALPYFISMASDLRYNRYKALDVLRIYGFNLILLPVNLAGVLKSMQQALTSRKIPFARTPKVRNRTVAPMLYILSPIAIFVFSVFSCWQSYQQQNWANATFAALNALLTGYAIVAYIGVGAAIVDVWRGATRWMYVPRKDANVSEQSDAEPDIDWREVLYRGAGENAHAVEDVNLALLDDQSQSLVSKVA